MADDGSRGPAELSRPNARIRGEAGGPENDPPRSLGSVPLARIPRLMRAFVWNYRLHAELRLASNILVLFPSATTPQPGRTTPTPRFPTVLAASSPGLLDIDDLLAEIFALQQAQE